jgi:hypothetical protein
MLCPCGNPAKIIVQRDGREIPMCWTCHRRKEGWDEYFIEMELPIDERLNRKDSYEKHPNPKTRPDNCSQKSKF